MADTQPIIENEQNSTSIESYEIPRSDKEDTVNNVFKIHLHEEIHDLSNEFCKYYYTTNTENNSNYFAIVYEQTFVAPLKIIDFLQKNRIAGINPVLDFAIVRISTNSSEHLVVIVESYDYNLNLSSYVQQNGIINITFAEEIIRNLTKIIETLSANGIYGYNITPNNILIKENKFFCLREFIDSYPYFHVQDQYVAAELIECHKAARKTNSYKPDIYALGMSIFYAYLGKTPWLDYSRSEEYNENRLEHSTYKYLLGKVKIPEALRNFLRATLNDDAQIRWKTQHIEDWLAGRAGKNVYDSIVDNKYTIGFNDKNYSNIKSLAYAIFRFWESANKFIKDNKLFKWAGKQQISSDMLEGIKHIVGSNTDAGSISSVNSSHKITKLLSIIDPNGGIRCENIALSPEAIPELLQYLSTTKKKIASELVLKIIQEQLWTHYSNSEATGHLDKTKADIYNRLIDNVNLSSPYKGLERLIYMLNPNLPCLSPLMDGKYINNIRDLLIALDIYAQKNSKNFSIDKHIIAFTAAKLDLKEDVPAVILNNFPKFAEHAAVRNLSVINILQQHESSIKLPNLCKILASELSKLFAEYLHNVEFKKAIIQNLSEASKTGEIADIIIVLNNQQQFIKDYNGYYEACKKAKMLEEQIKILGNQDEIFNNALVFGQKITVLISYILCFIVSVTIIL